MFNVHPPVADSRGRQFQPSSPFFLSEHIYPGKFMGNHSLLQTLSISMRTTVHQQTDPSRLLGQKAMIESSMEWTMSPSGIGGRPIQSE